MQQIINITEARNNLAKLIQKITLTKKPIVIIQDSIPTAVIYPYEEVMKNEEEKEKLFQLQFEKLLEEGKEIGKKYLKENNITKPLSEEETYNLIKNG